MDILWYKTASLNQTNDSTSLHLAASGGHPELVKFLLDAGSSATDENAEGLKLL